MSKTKIDLETAEHLADLSMLEFSPDEFDKIINVMENMIDIMNKVHDFDSSKTQSNQSFIEYTDLRTDMNYNSYQNEEILKNADVTENGCFVSPKTI